MNQVTILTGCAGCGKTERLLREYRAALERSQSARSPGSTLWISPNRRIQRELLYRIPTAGAMTCFAPNVLTFDLFAEKILASAGRPASPVSPLMRRLLLRRIVGDLVSRNELRYFQPIADTAGFLDVVSRFISELKRDEIWPETFVKVCRETGRASAQRDLELGTIYQEYQHQLNRQNWYDNEGRFWLARTAIAKEKIRRPFEQVKLLVLDGFADFTKTQYEILGHLAGWIDQIFISLPLENPLHRRDLFAKPQAAVQRIESELPKGVKFSVEQMSLPDTTKRDPGFGATTSRVISESLFSNPRNGQKSNQAPGLEIIAATGQMSEWQAVARRIKTLLSHSLDETTLPDRSVRTRPRDIVIGMRSLSSEGPRLRDYLVSAGLPAWCEAESPMSSSPVVKAVISLLNLELDDWPFDRLMSVLDSNFFQPRWPEFRQGEAVRAVAALLRQKQIHTGREFILKTATRSASDPAEGTTAKKWRALAQRAAPLLDRLSRCLERMRHSHSLSGWADLLAGLSVDLGWMNSDRTRSDQLADQEWQDLDLLQRHLRSAAEADQKISSDDDPRMLSLSEFTAELCDLVRTETGISDREPDGCVKILSVEQIRNLDVPHLFLVGLTENSFPRNQSDDCLFSESERKDFNKRGIPLKHRSSQHTEEMLLFYSVVTRARLSLTLSYPAVNAKGHEVFSSPYVSALRDLFAPDSLRVTIEGQLSPVPALDQTLTMTDLRMAAVCEARNGRPGLYRRLLDIQPLQSTCLNTLAACDVADHRFHRQGFTPYEGQLTLAQNLESLQKRFGPGHQFSATELESYARCPFQFWLSNVLRIGAVETPEEGTDYAGRGTLLHEILARLLFEGVMDDPTVLLARFLELIDEWLDRNVPETGFQKSMIAIERQILAQWAEAFVQQQSEYADKIREILAPNGSLPPEIPFGKLPDATRDDLTSHPAIQFGSNEKAVHLRGRIDRVDVGTTAGRRAYVVIDYKSGNRPPVKESDLISGRSIQLGLYLLAIKRLGLVSDDAIPFQMGYWGLRDTGFKPGMGGAKLKPIEPADVQWLETLFDHLLPQLANEIRSGRFVVENEDETCTGRCPYRTACRVNQLRPLADRLNKKSAPRTDPSDHS